MKVVFALLPALISAVLADVPTGCVTLWHVNYGNYLVAANRYDKNHRHVKDAERSEQWKIFRAGDGYRIKHADLNEYLFASYWTFANNNHVYLWIPKTDEESDKWTIEQEDKYYTIRNNKRGSCLFVGSLHWIYAKKAPMCNNKMFYWKIERC
uniref:Putative 16.8 kDa salivary protein n=1 Tax=Culex tarsalis TaxID=7177 RepID=A0A1Q3FHK6_CULTA